MRHASPQLAGRGRKQARTRPGPEPTGEAGETLGSRPPDRDGKPTVHLSASFFIAHLLNCSITTLPASRTARSAALPETTSPAHLFPCSPALPQGVSVPSVVHPFLRTPCRSTLGAFFSAFPRLCSANAAARPHRRALSVSQRLLHGCAVLPILFLLFSCGFSVPSVYSVVQASLCALCGSLLCAVLSCSPAHLVPCSPVPALRAGGRD